MIDAKAIFARCKREIQNSHSVTMLRVAYNYASLFIGKFPQYADAITRLYRARLHQMK